VESYSNETSVKINIKNESNLKDVIMILTKNGDIKDLWSFKLISFLKKYNKNIRSGDISLNGKYTNNNLINILRMPSREVVNLRIPENIRLLKDMIILIEDSMGFGRDKLKHFIDTSSFLKNNNLTYQTLPSFFIPNTYQLYSNITVADFMNRMIIEYNNFWNPDRVEKCIKIGISKIDISILASIVEEEQDKRLDERPKIAGLYLNRLNNPTQFPYLQADPTVKFACNDFTIKQVLNKHLRVDNPYNTYKYKGLPPGPICIPSINAIDAVLNAESHSFYFMCAGSNGDGYHKFTSSNREHNNNKIQYKNYQGLK
tara:strand:- start:25225 stop:26169 length:945 start_codon:yes stop_codon:yes gene_type:complete